MKLAEIDAGTKVQMSCATGSELRKFLTSVVSIRTDRDKKFLKKIQNEATGGELILLRPLRTRDGKSVHFDDSLRYAALSVNEAGKTLMWFNVFLDIVNFPDYGEVMVGATSNKMNLMNRRGAERVTVGAKGNVKFNNRSKQTIIVRDISASGISIILPKDCSSDVGDECKIRFEDKELDWSFKIKSLIVRKQFSESEGMILGCQFVTKPGRIEKYVMERKEYNEQQ